MRKARAISKLIGVSSVVAALVAVLEAGAKWN